MSAVDSQIDWSSVDPQDLSSLLMAAELGVFTGDVDEMRRRLDAMTQQAAERQVALAATPIPVMPASAVDEAGSGEDSISGGEDDEEVAGGSNGSPHSPTSDGAGDCECDDDGDEAEAEGMGSRLGTAEASWDETDWRLQRIVRRRRAAPQPRAVSEAADAAEHPDAPVELLWEYLCVWDGYAEPTWERGAFLMEMGFGKALAAFIEAKKPPKTAPNAKRLQPEKPPSHAEFHAAKQAARQSRRSRVKRHEWAEFSGRVAAECSSRAPPGFFEVLDKVVAQGRYGSVPEHGYSSLPSPHEDQCPATLDLLLRHLFARFADARLYLRRFRFVRATTLPKLLRRCLSEPGQLQIVFHGTQARAVQPIIDQGFRLPTEHKLGVVNGSVHGVGIYVGPTLYCPAMDTYSRDGDVFVCLLFKPAGSPSSVKEVSCDISVVSDADLVAPIFHFVLDRTQTGVVNIGTTTSSATGAVNHFFAAPASA